MKYYIDVDGTVGPSGAPVVVEFFEQVDHPVVYSAISHPDEDPCFFADFESEIAARDFVNKVLGNDSVEVAE